MSTPQTTSQAIALATPQDVARRQMVDQQVRAWDVFDPNVLEVMASVRREDFVPGNYRGVAFADAAVPLGHGQFMLPPSLDGKILQALAATDKDEALDIGTGSGFLAACLGRLADRVRTIELFPDLAAAAATNLQRAASNNVVVETLDAAQLGDEARYDVIALTSSLSKLVPLAENRYARALKPGGRMFVVVGEAPVMQALRIVRIGPEAWSQEALFETAITPLLHAPQTSPFVF